MGTHHNAGKAEVAREAEGVHGSVVVAQAEWLDGKRAHQSTHACMQLCIHALFVWALLGQAEREGQPERAGQDL